MRLGDRIRELREEFGFTQGQLAGNASVSQGYLSQLENGEVKNPSASVLLRVAQAMHIDPDELFEAAGYPTVRILKTMYEGYESNIDPDLLRYLGHLPRDRQRRLLLLLEGVETVVGDGEESEGAAAEPAPAQSPQNGRPVRKELRHNAHPSRVRG